MSYTFNSPSPYSAPRRPPKWPWAFAAILLIAVLSATFVLMQNGIHLGDNNGKDRDLALVTPTPREITFAPTQTPIPSPTPTELENPDELATEWITLWMNQNYGEMYRLTSAATRDSMTQNAFVAKYSDISRVAGIHSIAARLDGQVNESGLVDLTVNYESGLVGEISQKMQLQIIQEGATWKVVWSPSMIFTELGGDGCVAWSGETLNRGRILDRNGKVLAADKAVTRVSVIPANVTDPDTVYPLLADTLDMDLDEIYARVNAAPNASWAVVLKDMPADAQVSLLNTFANFTGISVKSATQRDYPYGATSVHLVGYVTLATADDIGTDESIVEGQLVGRTGVEYGANDILSGQPGGTLSAVECTTRAKRAEIAVTQGQVPVDVYLTVDIDFQKQVDDALTTAEKDIDSPSGTRIKVGQRGAVVVMDPETGAILAMVSHPSFDPNGYITQQFSAEDEKNLNDPVMLAWLNRAVSQALPTGSIFKTITMAGALTTLGYTDQTVVDCPAVFTLGDESWADWVVENNVTAQGALTLHQALVNSCNTVFYGIGADMDLVDPNALPDMAKAFGLGQPVNMPYFPSATGGVIPDPAWKLENLNDGWATGDNIQLAIGQGFMTATPLQMTVAYAAIANGGDVLVPYVVDKTQEAGKDPVQVGKREVRNKLPLDAQQIGWIQTALRSQTSDPYGYGSTRVFGYFPWSISGKTGTAQNDRANEDGRPHSWFAAYAPYPGDGETPELASIVMVENVGEGVSYAAPVTRIIYQDWLNSYGAIAPSAEYRRIARLDQVGLDQD